jgi:hypothetical protein
MNATLYKCAKNAHSNVCKEGREFDQERGSAVSKYESEVRCITLRERGAESPISIQRMDEPVEDQGRGGQCARSKSMLSFLRLSGPNLL